MNDNNIKKPPPSAEGVGGGRKCKERILRPYMKELSRKARRTPTDAEKALWQVLRNKNLGVMFRRQFVIDNVYIVDFVCLEKGLSSSAMGDSIVKMQRTKSVMSI